MTGNPERESTTEELERRNRELSILNAIAQALNGEVDLDRTLRSALALVVDLLGLQTGWIWLFREGTRRSYLAAAQNLPPGLAESPRRMEGSCYCLDTYLEGDLQGAANVNVVTCSRLEALVDGTAGLAYHASIPLYAHGRKLGVLNVASPDWRELSQEDLRLLYTVGDLVSIAVERARLFAGSVQVGALEERNRLAREIHDTLAQGLAAIALQLETADALLETGAAQEQARQPVRQALALAHSNLEEARRSVLDLRAAPLEDLPLGEALTALAEEQAAKDHFHAKVYVKGSRSPLPPRLEMGLYRIAQEALSNISRHAGASNVCLHLVRLPDRVQLTVEDDGRGFDVSQVPANCYGLKGMNERVKLLGGNLELQSSPGAGASLKAVIPLEAAP
jgi:two-component system, NarL family, sensor kinase